MSRKKKRSSLAELELWELANDLENRAADRDTEQRYCPDCDGYYPVEIVDGEEYVMCDCPDSYGDDGDPRELDFNE